jgi:hypothetical protein
VTRAVEIRTEAEARQVFQPARDAGAVTTLAAAVHSAADRYGPDFSLLADEDALDDYIRNAAVGFEPLFALPPADQAFPLLVERRLAEPQERKALAWVLPQIAATNSHALAFVAGLQPADRATMEAAWARRAIHLQDEDWPGFNLARRYGLVFNPCAEGLAPRLQWLYPQAVVLALVRHLLAHAAVYGFALILVPWDRRALPYLKAANDSLGLSGEALSRQIESVLVSADEKEALALIRKIRILRGVHGMNRAEVVDHLDPAGKLSNSIQKQITRLMPRIKAEIPGFDWPKTRRPKGYRGR